MPRKTQGDTVNVALPPLRFNEAAARCRGKLTLRAGAAAGAGALQ